VKTDESKPAVYQTAVTETKVAELRVAIAAADGFISRAAGELGLSRQQLTKLVKKYELGEFAAKLRSPAARSGSATGSQRDRDRSTKAASQKA